MLRYFWTNENDTASLDEQIDAVLEDMKQYGPTSPEYPELMKHLDKLYELKTKDKSKPVSKDTVIMVAGNLLGILLILGYERTNVMSTKAFTQIIRPLK